MFKLVKNLTTWWPVTVFEPDDSNPGSLVERKFQAQFVIRSREEVKELQEARDALVNELPGSDEYLADFKAATTKANEINAAIEAHDRKIFHLNITGWKDVVAEGDDETPMLFSPEALDMALNLDRVRLGLVKAYEEAGSNDKARLGNSKA
jgi:hypothetical protein